MPGGPSASPGSGQEEEVEEVGEETHYGKYIHTYVHMYIHVLYVRIFTVYEHLLQASYTCVRMYNIRKYLRL